MKYFFLVNGAIMLFAHIVLVIIEGRTFSERMQISLEGIISLGIYMIVDRMDSLKKQGQDCG